MNKTKIVDWLYDYCVKSKKSGYIVGLSDGIDSSVASTLCAETGLNVLVVSLPIYSDENTIHMNWLDNRYTNVSASVMDLSKVCDEFKLTLGIYSNMTLANLKSRVRMVMLYALASEYDLLVCGTGNKVEDFGIGFYTKYGDGGVDISPLGDLMKSEVYEIGKELGIKREILEAKPTDGLWEDGRSDEDQIGCTYDELEWAMTFKHDRDITNREGMVLDIYNTFHNANKHKMEPIPIFKKGN